MPGSCPHRCPFRCCCRCSCPSWIYVSGLAASGEKILLLNQLLYTAKNIYNKIVKKCSFWNENAIEPAPLLNCWFVNTTSVLRITFIKLFSLISFVWQLLSSESRSFLPTGGWPGKLLSLDFPGGVKGLRQQIERSTFPDERFWQPVVCQRRAIIQKCNMQIYFLHKMLWARMKMSDNNWDWQSLSPRHKLCWQTFWKAWGLTHLRTGVHFWHHCG